MRKFYFLVLGLLIFSGVKAQIVNIPDANFKKRLLESNVGSSIAASVGGIPMKIDANNDGEIQLTEAQNVSELKIVNASISSLEGISSFSNLTVLYCSGTLITSLDVTPLVKLVELNCSNNQLATLDLPPLLKLITLDCSRNKLTSLNVKPLVNLDQLTCNKNQLTSLDVTPLVKLNILIISNNLLTSLDVTPLVKLRYLSCESNKLTSLDLKSLVYLFELRCEKNQLTSLDVTPLENLRSLSCNFNKLTSLDVTPLINLTTLFCTDNQLTSLDLSNQNQMSILDCSYNNLTSLFIKNTSPFDGNDGTYSLNFSPNKYLRYICANENLLVRVQSLVDKYGHVNCQVNSYCSFVPGGTFYTIQGSQKFDSNNNGCDASDIIFPNLKFSITDGINKGSIIANATGNYFIPVKDGTQTITPVLENSSYFNISPTKTVVTFPTQASPFTQDFCVTANGIHPDLEVTVLPINRARPGFDATYKIVYKNKGNQTQSGSVNLKFNDAVSDIVAANPVVTNQNTNTISWDFSDLKPFETRVIEVTVNVNSPLETPAVNGGDVLNYTATITSATTDETPTDNTFTLNQTVVNAFDPNDKTCLEGATIPPSAVGKYVHYLIRFENKGTAEAQNVVVKDMIDTSKFDISSLVVTQGSHPFVTRITETNKVEFIFENINLPFDDATNDGYVAFKIKTKPSLVVGDSFSNTASIYFDYNFPIVTNTATTSVLQSLGNIDFEFDSYFSVYPNPVQNSLNLDIKKQIRLSSISIYNTLGQQILVIPNEQYTKQVDVSNLKTGNYFIKLTSDKGSAIGKFIKS
jgi:hypothetical protein